MLIQYAIHGISVLDDEKDRYEFNVDDFNNEYLDIVAQECAEDYYDNHDGWEIEWSGHYPQIFRLFINNEVIGDFEIYAENGMYFSAQKINDISNQL